MPGAGGLPTGTVTFLFTDIEGSTRLWEQHPEEMKSALARHDEILRAAVESNGGHLVKATGDGVHAVFAAAIDGVHAAMHAQAALAAESWSVPEAISVRMGLHTGEAEGRDGDYFGTATNRAARLMAAANGGQVLLSLATEELVRDAVGSAYEIDDLGEHRLRDLARSERLFEIRRQGASAERRPVRSLDSYPTNLPVQLTSFVGRDAEVEAISEALEEARLVTLVGVGGVGKTRLATQVAAEVLPRFPDGVWLCELATATDPDSLSQVTAAALGVNRRAGVTVEASVVDFLRMKNLLVVLDNCEHLLDAAGTLVEDVLRACPDVRILATSREGLAVMGEQVWPLRSLRVPRSATDAELADVGAIRLFVERARAVRPAFDLEGSNAGAVVEICRRLDGIPLAIELAAARIEAMSAVEIAALLDERFRLLTGGRRTAVERHQTLRAAVDWSYSLLTETERQIFGRLAVFSGTFDAAAASEVVAGDGVEAWDVREALAALVAKSLIVREETAEGTTRYQMLETLRQYAREQLDALGTADSWRLRHAHYFMTFAETTAPLLLGADEIVWRPRVGDEIDNLRAAVLFGLDSDDPAAVEYALRTIAALSVEGTMRRSAGIVTWAEQALPKLDEAATPAVKMSVFGAAAMAATLRGEAARIQELANRALENGIVPECRTPNMALVASCLAQLGLGKPQDALELAYSHIREMDRLASPLHEFDRANLRGTAAIWSVFAGEDARGRELAEESLAIADRIRNPSARAIALYAAGLTIEPEDPDEALRHQEESIALTRGGASDVVLTGALARAGFLRARGGDRPGALSALREAIAHAYDDADPPGTAGAIHLAALGAVALRDDDFACTLAGGLRGALAPFLLETPRDTHELGAQLDAARQRMGDQPFRDALARGQAMSYDELIGYALLELDRFIADTHDV